MNKTTKRSKAAIVASLITLVRPMLPIMFCAILMGVAGYFCATFITIFGGFAILGAAGLLPPLPRQHRVCLHVGVCPAARCAALCRAGIQPFIAFKLLA